MVTLSPNRAMFALVRVQAHLMKNLDIATMIILTISLYVYFSLDFSRNLIISHIQLNKLAVCVCINGRSFP